jgi:RNA-directed DNA polymerase
MRVELVNKVGVDRQITDQWMVIGEGEDFLLSLLRIDEEGTIEIGDRAVQRLKERVHELWDARQSKTSQQLSQQWQSYIKGWWNYYQLAERQWNVKDLSGWIRRHMRKCFWQRWHNRKGRRKALQRLGIRGKALQWRAAHKGLGAWPNTGS